MTPTARSLKYCRELGWEADKTECYNCFSHKYSDLFGFIDIIALTEKGRVIAIQATTSSNMSARIKKIANRPAIPRILLIGGAGIEVWGWGKYKVKIGGKAVRWAVRRTVVDLPLLDQHEYASPDLPSPQVSCPEHD
jgi:hypothetical protein